MKRILSVSLIAGLLALGMAGQAEAVPSLQIVGLSGCDVCRSGSVQGPGPVNFTGITVGDYVCQRLGRLAFEGALQSNAAADDHQRQPSGNAMLPRWTSMSSRRTTSCQTPPGYAV